MIIYNVTNKVDHSIHEDWILWMKEIHIPEVMNTGCFSRFQFVRLLDTDESDGFTYATQYFAVSMEDYTRYLGQFANQLREKATIQWGNHFIAFRSLMELVY